MGLHVCHCSDFLQDLHIFWAIWEKYHTSNIVYIHRASILSFSDTFGFSFISLLCRWLRFFVKLNFGASWKYFNWIVPFVFTAYGDLGFDLKGYASGIFSNFSQAVYLILVQRFSKKNVCTASALQLNSYNTIPLLIILCVIFGEAQNLQTYDNYRSWEFCVIFPLTISMGCLLNYSLFLCTKYTCALTTSVVGGLKAMVQTIFGIFAFGGVSKNISTFLGIAMNLSGGTLYIYTKYKEGLHKKTDSQDGENSNTKEETPQITEVVINGFPANQASSPEGREQVKSWWKFSCRNHYICIYNLFLWWIFPFRWDQRDIGEKSKNRDPILCNVISECTCTLGVVVQ